MHLVFRVITLKRLKYFPNLVPLNFTGPSVFQQYIINSHLTDKTKLNKTKYYPKFIDSYRVIYRSVYKAVTDTPHQLITFDEKVVRLSVRL